MIIDIEKISKNIHKKIYIEKNDKNIYKQYFRITISSILYILLVIFQSKENEGTNISGIIAQILILISIYLVLTLGKKGFIAVIILNLISFNGVFIGFFIQKRTEILPALFLTPISFFIITIIYFFQKSLNNKISIVNNQKRQLEVMYDEVLKKEKLIYRKNKELIKYNEAMKKNEEKLNYLAFFDTLTELPNRKMIIDKINYIINKKKDTGLEFSIVLIGLDDFKKINDFVGHDYGDLLLKKIKEKLINSINKEDVLGRFGGDEFVLIIKQELKENEILSYLEDIRNSLSKAMVINNTEFKISASMGVATYPNDGEDSVDILKSADTAMNIAKKSGKNNIRFFDIKMKNEFMRRIEFENRLLKGIKKNEFYVEFQPQYNAINKELKGFEALVRWKSKELGVVSPGEFIPFAEETGIIIELGKFVFEEACKFSKYIQCKYKKNYMVSINVSTIQIMKSNFIEMVKEIINKTDVNPKNLEIEITESVFINSRDYAIEVINDLKDIGISIALDDFGTGYSSLSYLQILPIDKLKIDKTFIDSINSENSKKEIIVLIISLMRKMGIITVAEGIETEEQLKYLRQHRCDIIQGYLWGKPLKKDLAEELIKSELNIKDK